MGNNYIRESIHPIEDVKNAVEKYMFTPRKNKILFCGDYIKPNSQRYQLFFTKGIKCVCCGVEGKYFAKEKIIGQDSYHLNLYGIDKNGNEVLITKDHIIPVSKGGKNGLSNYQTMCAVCNEKKGNKLEVN